MTAATDNAAATLNAAGWWRGASIYQIYPRSFADSNHDGIGDLPGITAHMEYVAALGVDAIWLSPFFTSPMRDFGYDVADYCNVDPMFGSLADFDQLIRRAHELKLRVIIDQVYSHTSDQHAWFQESRTTRNNIKADWYVWADAKPDGSPPSNWQSVFGGAAWTWDARRGQYYLHNFLTSQPDLNVHNAAVQDALLASSRFWLDRGVDGFRLDAINYAMHDPALRDNPPALANGKPRTRPSDFQQAVHNMSHPDVPRFLERVRALLNSYGDRFTVAEVGGADAEPTMKLYTQGSARLHSAYGFNFLYADALTPELISTALQSWPDLPGTGWPSWAFSNHDAPRAVSRWATAADRDACACQCLLLLTCLRGNIFIYQGEELGLPQAVVDFKDLKDPEAITNWPHTLGRDGARTPMPWVAAQANAGFSSAKPWLPVSSEQARLAVDLQNLNPASMLTLARRLLTYRRNSRPLRCGTLRLLKADAGWVAFERSMGRQRLLCVFNLGAAANSWQPDDHSEWRIVERVGGGTHWLLPAYSGLIAEHL